MPNPSHLALRPPMLPVVVILIAIFCVPVDAAQPLHQRIEQLDGRADTGRWIHAHARLQLIDPVCDQAQQFLVARTEQVLRRQQPDLVLPRRRVDRSTIDVDIARPQIGNIRRVLPVGLDAM